VTKKDYELVASIVGSVAQRYGDGSDGQRAVRQVAGNLASGFALDNPRFDRSRFLMACEREYTPPPRVVEVSG